MGWRHMHHGLYSTTRGVVLTPIANFDRAGVFTEYMANVPRDASIWTEECETKRNARDL
jgi:hypothetical protein